MCGPSPSTGPKVPKYKSLYGQGNLQKPVAQPGQEQAPVQARHHGPPMPFLGLPVCREQRGFERLVQYMVGRRRRQGRLPGRKTRLQAIPHPRQRQVAPRYQSQLLLDVLPVLAIFPSVPKRKFLSVQGLFTIGSLRAVQAATSFPGFSSWNPGNPSGCREKDECTRTLSGKPPACQFPDCSQARCLCHQ